MTNDTFHIAVVAGGYSGERSISLLSAGTIMQRLNKQPHITPHLVVIDRKEWVLSEEDKHIQ